MDPMTNKVKVWKYLEAQTIETNNFTSEVKIYKALKALIVMAKFLELG